MKGVCVCVSVCVSEGGGRRAAEQPIECVSARQRLYVSVRVSECD